ncbi:MAG: DUF4440 domain-containing protein [Mycobacteriaceae bacterium]
MTINDSAPDPDTAEVIRRELMLLDPDVRASSERVLALLHPDFVEIGASGRRWDAAGIASALERAGDEEAVEAREMIGSRLAADVVLLTFQAGRPGRVTVRSSVWVRLDGQWRLRFHQGTVAAG